jgi:hypothetical protein
MSSETGIPIPFDPDALPCGLDRADGQGAVNMGTAPVEGQVKYTEGYSDVNDGADAAMQEYPDSPVLENAEQQTVTHRFHGGSNTVFTALDALHRGIIRTDSNGFYHKLLSAVGQQQDANHADLTTVDEVMGGDTPPDLFEPTPIDLGLSIIKHPRYFYAFLGDGLGSTTEQQNQMVIRILQNYFENTTAAYRDALQYMLKSSLAYAVASGTSTGVGPQPPSGMISASDGSYIWHTVDLSGSGGASDAPSYLSGTTMALAAALEIVVKYWRGEEQPPVYGFQIVWTEFSWFPLNLNPGGYIVLPGSDEWAGPENDPYNPLPDYFWNTHFPPGSTDSPAVDSMFARMDQVNPQCYSKDGTKGSGTAISWRREPDVPVRDRTFWAIQHKWVGSPVGYWDPDLFTQNNAPQVYTDYHIPA